MKENGFIDLFDIQIERDYVWVEDLAEIFYQSYSKDINNGIYNLGGGNPISHREIAEMVVKNYLEVRKNNGNIADFIKPIQMPEDLKQKFQFYTFAEDLLPFVASITANNKAKMKNYIKELIDLDNEN
jgi:ADP-L-glycero-D-manno-heptose 6-epimerase